MRSLKALVIVGIGCALHLGTTCHGATTYACRNRFSGALRVVAAPADCAGTEERVSWDTIEPRGPAGAAGTQGPTGPQGAPSEAGAQEATGPQGARGAGATAYRFVGITVQTFSSGNRADISRACSSEYRGSRLSTSAELLFSTLPPETASHLWAAPTLTFTQGHCDNYSELQGCTFDATGVLVAQDSDEPGRTLILYNRTNGLMSAMEQSPVACPAACSAPE